MKFSGSALSFLMACLFVGQTDGQDSFNVFFLMRDIENMSPGDEIQLAYFESREDIGFVDLWDNNRIRDDTAWLDLDPLTWADAADLVWVDESVSSSRVEDIQETTTPIINNENYACDILGIIGPGGADGHGSPGTLNDDGIEITAGTHFGTDILIVEDTHPIAVGAGLSNGVHTIYNDLGMGADGGGRMSWCTPNEEADIIALIPGFENEYLASTIFVHEEGDVLADGRIAPGMRIGSFLSDTNRGPAPPGDPSGGTDGTGPGWEATLLTDEGFALIESIVNYALGIPPGGGQPDGDYDDDGTLGLPDIDILVGEIAAGNTVASLDLNQDGEVNSLDVESWLSIAGNENLGEGRSYLAGDADLNGVVEAADLNQVGINWLKDVRAWSAGDFNADGTVGAPDLNVLGINWQQSAVAASTAAVPEPNGCLLVVMGSLLLLRNHRRSQIMCG
jgi:hypothetical protein